MASNQTNISNDRNPALMTTENDHHLFSSRSTMLNEDVIYTFVNYHDNEFIWKIKDFTMKRGTNNTGSLPNICSFFSLVDSQISLTNSIYSPEFRSSSIDYLMRLQMFPNGNSRARGTHISLFLSITIDNYDVFLHRSPLNFEAKFSLFNRSRLDYNHTRSFCFNIDSSGSQRTHTLMGICPGVSECFSLDFVEQNIHDEALFIGMTLDVLGKNSGTAFSLERTISFFI